MLKEKEKNAMMSRFLTSESCSVVKIHNLIFAPHSLTHNWRKKVLKGRQTGIKRARKTNGRTMNEEAQLEASQSGRPNAWGHKITFPTFIRREENYHFTERCNGS